MKTKILGLLVVGLLVTSGPATATILQGTTNSATGINGLVIGGTTYDVTFSATTFNSPFPTGPASNIAATDLAAALNSLGVTSLAGASIPFVNSNYSQLDVFVDNGATSSHTGAYNNACQVNSFVCSAGAWSTLSGFAQHLGYERVSYGANYDYYTVAAQFSVAPPVVPASEPGTLALLGVGLIGLALSRRRKAIGASAVVI